MRVNHSLKHATESIYDPILGTEAVDGLYIDAVNLNTKFIIIVVGNDSHWFSNTFLTTHDKNNYHGQFDKRFSQFPKNSVITFTQTETQ